MWLNLIVHYYEYLYSAYTRKCLTLSMNSQKSSNNLQKATFSVKTKKLQDMPPILLYSIPLGVNATSFKY